MAIKKNSQYYWRTVKIFATTNRAFLLTPTFAIFRNLIRNSKKLKFT